MKATLWLPPDWDGPVLVTTERLDDVRRDSIRRTLDNANPLPEHRALVFEDFDLEVRTFIFESPLPEIDEIELSPLPDGWSFEYRSEEANETTAPDHG